MKIPAILFSLLCMSPGLAYAYDGSELSRWAASFQRLADHRADGGDEVDGMMFLGYVAGTAATLSNIQAICLPPKTTSAQIAAVVAKYVADHPERWNTPANALVGASLVSAFPCK